MRDITPSDCQPDHEWWMSRTVFPELFVLNCFTGVFIEEAL